MKDMNTRSARAEAGFTLIEIAIVLVIIGLLLGGVLQGQQLIENSRVRSAMNDFNGIAAAAFSYQDRYGRLPGDDPGANETRGTSWTRAAGNTGDGNGVLDNPADLFNPGAGEEVAFFFQDLRSAGFINGDPTQSGPQALPQNPFGGLTAVTNEAIMGPTAQTRLAGMKVCMSNVTGSAAIALDTQLDDGQPDTGRFRATEGSGNLSDLSTPASDYSEDSAYTVCYRI